MSILEHEQEIRAIQRRLAEIAELAERLPEPHRVLAATHMHAASILLGWPDVDTAALTTMGQRLFWRKAAREERDKLREVKL